MDLKCFLGGIALGKKATTAKQAAILKRHGISVPLLKSKASRLISEVKEKQRIRDHVLEQRIAEEIKAEKMKLALLERELLAQKTRQREAELAKIKSERGLGRDPERSK